MDTKSKSRRKINRDQPGGYALITGAANGIGESTAWKFARNNYKVFLVDIQEKIHEVVKQINTELGQEVAFGFVADVSDSKQVDASFDACMKVFDGKLDVLVNNAGEGIVNPDNTPISIEQMTNDILTRQFSLNIFSMFYFCKNAVPIMKNNKHGTIINIGSVSSNGIQSNSHYSASKAAVEGLTKTLARELAPEITAICLAPGFVDTNLIHRKISKDIQNIALNYTLTKSLIPAWEIANLILFLSSNDSRNLTGQILHINAGMTLR